MPRTKPLLSEDRDKEYFRSLLEVKRAQSRFKSWAKVSESIGVPKDTLYTWLKKPEAISREHLKQLFKCLNFTPEEIYESFGMQRR